MKTPLSLRPLLMVLATLCLGGAFLSPLHAEDVGKMFDQAHKLFNEGKPDQALPIAQKLANGNHGLTEISQARVQNLYGGCLQNTGKTDQAIEAFKKGEKIYESLKQSERDDYDLLLLNLSIAQRHGGKFDDAEKTLLKLLELAEKKRSQWEPWFVERELSIIHSSAGDLDKALEYINKSYEGHKRSRSKDELRLAWILGDLTDLHHRKKDAISAAKYAQEWIVVARRAYKPDDPNLAGALKSCGEMLIRIQKVREGHAALEEAAAIYMKHANSKDSNIIKQATECLVSLAIRQVELGKLREAETSFQNARNIIDRNPAALAAADAYWHSGRASQYVIMSDMDKAVRHGEQSLAIYTKIYGKEHADTRSAQALMAQIYQRAGRSDQAANLNKELGDNPGAADPQNTLRDYERRGWELFNKGEYDAAEKVFVEEYKKIISDYGKDHPWVASALYNLLNTSYAQKDDRKGAGIYNSLTAFMKSHGDKADPELQRDCYNGLAVMAHHLKKHQEARAWGAKWYVAYAQHLNSVLVAGTQQQRLDFTSRWKPYGLFVKLEDTRALATMALRLKGVVMDSVLEERRHALMSRDPKHRGTLAELTQLKEQYRKLTFSRDAASQQQALKVQEQIEAKEKELAGLGTSSGTTRRALGVTVEDVQKKLPEGAVLIEFLRYMTPLNTDAYGAVLIPAKGPSKWVPLMPAHQLDGFLRDYKFISNHFGHPQLMERASIKLHEILWQPIQKQLPDGTNRLVISPDSDVCFISFATLIDGKGKFLCEKYDIQYVASGRDLLRQPYKMEMEKAKDSMAIYADPSYLTGPEAKSGGPRWMTQLPGAREEGKQLKELADGWNWKTTLLIDEAADEGSLRNMPAPRILHLSTHGFYFDHMPHPGKKGQEANPMLKSGLALAGAENTFRKWRAGKPEDPSNDGILMADEIGDLNLRGTWLVCLSACQTGGGEAKSGEGVMGMRRGFVEAGAQHLISTLWPIPDDTTVPFMKDYYTRLREMQDPALTLSRVQRDWLVKMRDESKSAGVAIIKAGAFITSSYGKPGS